MRRQIAPCALITFFLFAAPIVGAPIGKWVEVRSPNFIVVSNAGEGQARKIAVQFEQVRSLFRESLAYANKAPRQSSPFSQSRMKTPFASYCRNIGRKRDTRILPVFSSAAPMINSRWPSNISSGRP